MKKFFLGGLFLLFCLSYIIYKTFFYSSFEIHFLDVGQGDATYIRLTNGKDMLIDCGKDFSVLYALSSVMDFYDRTIDYLLVTHPDSDHILGCFEVLNRFTVKNIILHDVLIERTLYYDYLNEIKEKKNTEINIIPLSNFNYIIFDQQVSLKKIYPMESYVENVEKNINNYSPVILVSFQEQNILLMGDAEKEVEEYIIKQNIEIPDIEILKLGHHGSITSSTYNFLQYVNPVFGVISCGRDNQFNHPHPAILSRVNQMSIQALRTDIQGTISFVF